MHPNRRKIIGGAVGNVLEWCDFAVFGGTAPLVATWLIHRTGDLAAPAWYLIVIAGISCLVTLTLRPHAD